MFAVEQGVLRGRMNGPRIRFGPAPVVTIVANPGGVLGTAVTTTSHGGEDARQSHFDFVLPLPLTCFGRGELHLVASANGVAFAEGRTRLTLLGYLDELYPDRTVGWVFCPEVPNKRFDISVLRDGREIGKGPASRYRGDLYATYPETPDTSFDIAFNAPHRDVTDVVEVSFRLAGTDVEIPGGPYLAGYRAGMIATARSAFAESMNSAPTRFEEAVMRKALRQFIEKTRSGPDYLNFPVTGRNIVQPLAPRLTIVIPIYSNPAVTRACIESLLCARDPSKDRVVLVNDASPDAAMAPMLASFAGEPNLEILANEINQGFVRTVNRALARVTEGDVLLLNADTEVYAGAIEEMYGVAHASPNIGTVTALSDNATIFSYPHPKHAGTTLPDIGWPELAALCLEVNSGVVIDVPTAHGFCMFIRRSVLDQLGGFDESFGRGYSEENEFCGRASDFGWRHVAAVGVLVRHLESVSFGHQERLSQLAINLPRLHRQFPEYQPLIMAFEQSEGLRAGRWKIDAARLGRASRAGRRFALVVSNWLTGGTQKCQDAIEDEVGYGGAVPLHLYATADGLMLLECPALCLKAAFKPDELEALDEVLAGADAKLMVVHQLLGYTPEQIRYLTGVAASRHTVTFVHDYYFACPRATLIDAADRFCGVAEANTCLTCTKLGGRHEAARDGALTPAEHRLLTADFLRASSHVVVPSHDTARHLSKAFPDLVPTVLPHMGPTAPSTIRLSPRSFNSVALVGALGLHKGSRLLRDIARQALLTHPLLRFQVIGYTDIDEELRGLGNVSITGPYEPEDLPALLGRVDAGCALFLHIWPETFSYTLSEVAAAGLFPLVPDIGAPAERVRQADYGKIFAFPATPDIVLAALDQLPALASSIRPRPEAIMRLLGSTNAADVEALWRPGSNRNSVVGQTRANTR